MLPLFLIFTLSFILIVTTTFFLRPKQPKHDRKHPSGPSGYPLIGNLHMLGTLPHRSLEALSKKHGPIMSLRLGQVPTVIVSSSSAAEQFLKANDLAFASRPKLEATHYLSYGSKGLVFAEYGAYWRNMRKICTLQLLSVSKVDSFASLRKREMELALKLLKKAASSSEVVDVSEFVHDVVMDIVCKMVVGCSIDEVFDLKRLIQQGMNLSGAFNLADYVPFLRVFDLQVCIPSKIKAIVLDMIAGAFETSATVVEWALSELMRHPRVMKNLQQELDNVVGVNKMVEEKDLSKLSYLDIVIMETLRLYPAGPLVPRVSTEDAVVDGYFLEKKSRIIVNLWAIGRDSKIWSDNAEEFYPERFVDKNLDYRGNDFQFIPFGFGRRGCPGINLGLTTVKLVVAQLVHCFSWELPSSMTPNDLDMTEKFGLSIPRAKHLLAVPNYRLHGEAT
ncbi:cytochrome P450 CYP736A12-like [Vicia villosa]|uniref:cytochrome P450 CYP736A12-like n=1 Tax=Vicia villosa TaxID=3911 RepID=UPI00273CAC36|nr:cytochrome P450 CYP736A12-like [Vicia villosa]